MNFPQWLRDIIAAVVASGILSPILYYLLRRFLEARVSKDVESFKSSLVKDVEEFKFELGRQAYEHQVRFSRLQDRVFLTIAELYQRLVRAHGAMASYTAAFVFAGAPSEDERAESARVALNAFMEFYYENQIYFNEETCGLIEKLLAEHRSIFNDFAYRKLDPRKSTQTWVEVNKRFEGQVVAIKRAIESTFRQRLGVT